MLGSPRSPWNIAELRWQLAETIYAISSTMKPVEEPTEGEDGVVTRTEWKHSILAALACVSKGFTEPAVTFLWRDLFGLTPVLEMMSQLAWRDTSLYMPNGARQTPITPREWTTISYYTSKVKSLVVSSDRGHKDFAATIRALSQFKTRQYDHELIFPNLAELEITSKSREIAVYVELFLSSALQTLKIEEWPQALPEGHGAIPRKAPQLKSLTLTSTTSSPGFQQVVKDLEHLEVLFAPYVLLEVDTVRSLAQRPSLRRLDVNLQKELDLPRNSFFTLEHLNIKGDTDVCTEILEAVSSERFATLEIIDTSGVKSFPRYAAIAEKKWLSSLVDVSLAVAPETIEHDDPIRLSALQPLLRCQKIARVRVLGQHPSLLGSDTRVISDFVWPFGKLD